MFGAVERLRLESAAARRSAYRRRPAAVRAGAGRPADSADDIIWPIVAGMLAAALPAQLLKGVAAPDEIHDRPGRDAAQRHHRDGPGAVAARPGRRRAPRAAARHPAGRARRAVPGAERCPTSGWPRSSTRTAIAAPPRSTSACRAGTRTRRRCSPRSPTICGSPTREQAPDQRFARAAATAEATLADLVARARRRRPVRGPDRRLPAAPGPVAGRPARGGQVRRPVPAARDCAGSCCSSAPTWPRPGVLERAGRHHVPDPRRGARRRARRRRPARRRRRPAGGAPAGAAPPDGAGRAAVRRHRRRGRLPAPSAGRRALCRASARRRAGRPARPGSSTTRPPPASSPARSWSPRPRTPAGRRCSSPPPRWSPRPARSWRTARRWPGSTASPR